MKVKHIIVKLEDYNRYYEQYGHDRLDKWTKIYSKNKQKLLKELGGFIIEEEIFNGIETKYDFIKNNDSYHITFSSNSNTRYRFDLFKEPNTNIYHLGFSLFDRELSEYNELTDKYESLEIFNRLIWILKDIIKLLPVDYELCIGFDSNKRNRIYEYMMRNIKNWEKRNTNQYDNGWGIYFKI